MSATERLNAAWDNLAKTAMKVHFPRKSTRPETAIKNAEEHARAKQEYAEAEKALRVSNGTA